MGDRSEIHALLALLSMNLDEVAGKPLRPRKAEAQYLVDRVQREIERNTGVLSDAAVAEFREALRAYTTIAATAE